MFRFPSSGLGGQRSLAESNHRDEISTRGEKNCEKWALTRLEQQRSDTVTASSVTLPCHRKAKSARKSNSPRFPKLLQQQASRSRLVRVVAQHAFLSILVARPRCCANERCHGDRILAAQCRPTPQCAARRTERHGMADMTPAGLSAMPNTMRPCPRRPIKRVATAGVRLLIPPALQQRACRRAGRVRAQRRAGCPALVRVVGRRSSRELGRGLRDARSPTLPHTLGSCDVAPPHRRSSL